MGVAVSVVSALEAEAALEVLEVVVVVVVIVVGLFLLDLWSGSSSDKCDTARDRPIAPIHRKNKSPRNFENK